MPQSLTRTAPLEEKYQPLYCLFCTLCKDKQNYPHKSRPVADRPKPLFCLRWYPKAGGWNHLLYGTKVCWHKVFESLVNRNFMLVLYWKDRIYWSLFHHMGGAWTAIHVNLSNCGFWYAPSNHIGICSSVRKPAFPSIFLANSFELHIHGSYFLKEKDKHTAHTYAL